MIYLQRPPFRSTDSSGADSGGVGSIMVGRARGVGRRVIAGSVVAAGVAGLYRWWMRPLWEGEGTKPVLRGVPVCIGRTWGTLTYRKHIPRKGEPVVVFVHGWSGSGDSSWWQIVRKADFNFITIDLPGHGDSELNTSFSFDLAASAILDVVSRENIESVILVGNSMGGPSVLRAVTTCTERGCGRRIRHVLLMATSAYWVKPRAKMIVGLAPYLADRYSPIPAGVLRMSVRKHPDWADIHAWGLQAKPGRRVLLETSRELRKFDGRGDTRVKDAVGRYPLTWVVTTQDGVIPPARQLNSAQMYDAAVIELDSHHGTLGEHADALVEILRRLVKD